MHLVTVPWLRSSAAPEQGNSGEQVHAEVQPSTGSIVVERLKHARTPKGVAICGRPARLEDLVDGVEANCRDCIREMWP